MEGVKLEEINKLKVETEEKYKKIGKLFCPALKSEISFNSEGFHHLRFDGGGSERDKNVQKNKFNCFDSAVQILKQTTTIQEYRRMICPIGKIDQSGFRKTKIIEWFSFFAIVNFTKCIRIRVIVRRVGRDNGRYHFWSVMPYWNLSNGRRVVGSKDIEDG
jgi:hypothetical protein